MTEEWTAEQYREYQAKKKAKAYKRRPQPDYDPTVDPLQILMRVRKIPMRMELGPEDRLTILFADCLRALTLGKVYNHAWGHIPNEAKRHEFIAMLLHRQGMIPGATDYVLGLPSGTGWMEFKVKPNALTPNQLYFRDWCAQTGEPWACITAQNDTYPERRDACLSALRTMAEWGAFPFESAVELTRNVLPEPA